MDRKEGEPEGKSWAERLGEAARLGDTGAAREALGHVSPDERTGAGWTSLHWACASESSTAEVARLLLEAGADPRSRGPTGWTPLCLAAETAPTEVLEELLKAGVGADEPGPEGARALLLAAAKGRAEAIRPLLSAGANPNGQPGDRSSPLERAGNSGRWGGGAPRRRRPCAMGIGSSTRSSRRCAGDGSRSG